MMTQTSTKGYNIKTILYNLLNMNLRKIGHLVLEYNPVRLSLLFWLDWISTVSMYPVLLHKDAFQKELDGHSHQIRAGVTGIV